MTVTLNIQYATNRSKEGKLSFIWNDPSNSLSSLNDDELLMELVFLQKTAFIEEDISISSDIAAIEAWDGSYNKHSIVKGAGKIITTQKNIYTGTKKRWNVTPNPTRGTILVNLQLLNPKSIRFELFNTEGKLLLTQNAQLPKGLSNTRLNFKHGGNLLAAGIYYLKVSGIEGSGIQKIILIN